MKTLLTSRPVLSFIILTFIITFLCWFLPVIFTLPKDIGFAAYLIGGCGPLLAGYILTLLKSDARVKIGSVTILIIIAVVASVVLFLRMYLIHYGLSDINGFFPVPEEVSPLGYLMLAVPVFIVSLNISNAVNTNLKENYLRSFLFEKRKIKWYLTGLLLFPGMSLISYIAGTASGLETTDYLIKIQPVWFVALLSTFFFTGGNEEFGWRGFLQKEMQKKYNPLITALVISFLWSFWHLPLHYNGLYTTGGFVDLLPRILPTIPLTIIFTWFYNKSSYSILAVAMLHAVINNSFDTFGLSPVIAIILFLLLSGYCIYDDKMWKRKDYHLVYERENL